MNMKLNKICNWDVLAFSVFMITKGGIYYRTLLALNILSGAPCHLFSSC